MADLPPKRAAPIADPAPLGLAGFAATTYILSAHNIGWCPDIMWVGLALFYGGLAQLLAGMWEYRNNNTFGATAFSTYGAFWMSLAAFKLMVLNTTVNSWLSSVNTSDGLGWFLSAFAIFTFYMCLCSTMLPLITFLVFLTLTIAFFLLFIGEFQHDKVNQGWTKAGGVFGGVCALLAWYNSFAVVFNRMAGFVLVPMGRPLFDASMLNNRRASTSTEIKAPASAV